MRPKLTVYLTHAERAHLEAIARSLGLMNPKHPKEGSISALLREISTGQLTLREHEGMAALLRTTRKDHAD